MTNRISFCTPVFNKSNFTEAYLKDLSNLDPDLHEIIIVDNASSDNTQKLIEDWKTKIPNLVYIRNENNTGFGYASNQAYQIAKHNIVCFLNNDIKVHSSLNNWTNVYFDAISENPDQLISPTGGLIDVKKGFSFVHETEQAGKDFNYLSGWMLLGTKTVFDKLVEKPNVGPFRADLYFAYYEDTHLSFKAKELGIKQTLLANNVVQHYGKITSKQINLAKLFLKSKETFTKEWGSK